MIIIGEVIQTKSMIFEVFENTSEKFRYFFMESFLIARSYRVHLINIKIVIMGALVTLETQLKVPTLAGGWGQNNLTGASYESYKSSDG